MRKQTLIYNVFSLVTVKNFIRYYEIFQNNDIDYGNILEKLSSNKLGAITSLCEYEYTCYKYLYMAMYKKPTLQKGIAFL